MKKIPAIFLFVLAGLIITSFQRIDGYAILIGSFNKIGLKYEKACVSGWVRLNQLCGSDEDMRKLADKIYSSMAGKSGYGMETCTEQNNKISIKGTSMDSDITITISPYPYIENSKCEQTVAIDVTQYDSIENIIDVRREVKNCLSQYGDDPRINVCISGFMKGRADKQAGERIIKSTLNDLNAGNIKTLMDGNIISACGYTRFIPEYINCAGENINVDMACRYSSYDDRTYFLIGTPVICFEY